MRQTWTEREEEGLETERRIKFKGTARVSIESIYFPKIRSHELDVKHVETLKDRFRVNGCRRLEVRNHIPAVIDQQSLDAALRAAETSVEELLTTKYYRELVFPVGSLECLHGRHRIEAGREFLSPGDKWWTVDLYLRDVNDDLKTCLIEEYANEGIISDGEIYCKIRQYHFQQNLSYKTRWLARLRGNRLNNLMRLFRNYELTAAFDALLEIPGLWDGMLISTLHKLMSMKCESEILSYLKYIKDVWLNLVGGNKDALREVDRATVKALELRAPQASTQDLNAVQSQLRAGVIFGTLDNHTREIVQGRLELIDGIIPSLFTFFKDLQYLQRCVDCLKRLISISSQETVRTAMDRSFTGLNQKSNRVVIQVTESTFTTRPGSVKDQLDNGRQQLFAYAMRHFPDMPKESTGDDLLIKPTVKANQRVLRGFADLANDLGFESDEIRQLKKLPDFPGVEFESESRGPLLVTDGPGEPRRWRCGPPRTRTYKDDRKRIFLRYLENGDMVKSSNITSFFVLKAKYKMFFGTGTSHEKYDSLAVLQQEDARLSQSELEQMEIDTIPGDDFTERLEQERLEQERRKQERREQRRLEQVTTQKVSIHLYFLREGYTREGYSWKELSPLLIDPLNPVEVERMARQKLQQNIRTFNTKLRMMAPENCFETVTTDGTNTIMLIPEKEGFVIDEQLVASVSHRNRK